MDNSLQKKQFQLIESNFNLSRNLLSVLFIVSFTGIIIGIAGWILSPVFLWKMPDINYIIITIATFILLGITLAGKKYMQNLRMAYAQLSADAIIRQ